MTTVLVWGASPIDRSELLLSVEFDAIRDAVQRSTYRDEFEIHVSEQTQAIELIQDLLTHHPRLLHFSGHGRPSGELILEDADRGGVPVEPDTLGEVLARFEDDLAVVVLAACWSQVQASAVNLHIPIVVGMDGEVGDTATLSFAAIFYHALGEGKAVTEAFELARAQLAFTAPDLHRHARILVRPGTGDLVVAGPGSDGSGDGSAAGSEEREQLVTAAFHAHYGPLVRLVSTLLDDTPGAETIVREAFVDLLYEPTAPIGAAVAAYLRRKVMAAARSARNRRQAEASASSERDRVLRIIRGLPEPTAEVLLMKHLGALDDETVASTLSLTPASVAEHASVGLAEIQRQLGAAS
jgi:DNA-directed RNA polymerase specialized sigma24 family protein